MSELREPFATLASDLVETLLGALKECKSRLDYPDSHSAMHVCVEAVLRKYDVKLRAVPLDRAQILEPPAMCPVCMQPLGDTVAELRAPEGARIPRRFYAHPACVNYPKRTT
jgi:hypothetical protein